MVKENNIDFHMNQMSCNIVNKLRKNGEPLNIIDKALGVLSNDGVYGYYVYIKSQIKEKDKVKNPIFQVFIRDIIDNFAHFVGKQLNKEERNLNDYDRYFNELSQDIHDLLFFKDILEGILVYARYHAKAIGDGNE